MAEILVKSNLNLGNVNKIINVAAPSNANDVATKSYVDNIAAGQKWKIGVQAASTTNINLAGAVASVDDVLIGVGTRVLVKDQTVPAQNGIYTYDGSLLVRSDDADVADELNSAIVSVLGGTTNSNRTYRQTQTITTVGSDSIGWEIFGSAVADAGTTQKGIIEIATLAEVDTGASAFLAVTPSTLANSRYLAKRYTTVIGDGIATSYEVVHGLNTDDVNVFLKDTAFKQQVMAQVVIADSSKVVITTNSPVNTGAITVTVTA